MQLHANAVETYEVGNLARWWEWEAPSEGRRQLTWSGRARDLRNLPISARKRATRRSPLTTIFAASPTASSRPRSGQSYETRHRT